MPRTQYFGMNWRFQIQQCFSIAGFEKEAIDVMTNVYHLNLDKKAVRNSNIALLPGDPQRVKPIAEEIAKTYNGRIKALASKREFTTYIVETPEKNILVTSTGIGGPSTAIAIEELARLGVKTFIRVGTTGAIQSRIHIGDVIITTAAVRLDGASRHYAPLEYPAVADFSVVSALTNGAKKAALKYHIGVTASSDTFYPGEGRSDSYRKYIIRNLMGATKEWRNLNVLNYEMESAAVLTMTSSMALKGGCITGVVNRGGHGIISEKNLRLGEKNVIRAAAESIGYL